MEAPRRLDFVVFTGVSSAPKSVGHLTGTYYASVV